MEGDFSVQGLTQWHLAQWQHILGPQDFDEFVQVCKLCSCSLLMAIAIYIPLFGQVNTAMARSDYWQPDNYCHSTILPDCGSLAAGSGVITPACSSYQYLESIAAFSLTSYTI
jgi:hypothetical protein